MKISLNWIKDYVDLSDVKIDDLLKQFTLSVAEIEGVEQFGKELSGVVAAKIVSLEKHPNSKKLHVLKVDIGEKELVDVVCGAPNCRVGMVVPFAKIGANVNGFKIGKAKLAGVDSCGMCCSGEEVGLNDDNDGLWELAEDTVLGTDIKELYPLEDTVFEVDNKSLTNRPDLWGHYGIAREIAALVNKPLKPIQVADLNKYNDLEKLNIQVKSKNVLRYSGLSVANITRKVSNETMQIRLFYAGMRPINLLADITNYLMLELGQPMHAFDNAKVQHVQVYDLAKEERFLTLDGVTRTLPQNTTVIATNNTPVAIAGIMGGELSGINNDTNSVLIESATFDAATIRRTATALGLRSEASSRYEKTLDPELTPTALARYVYLLQSLDNGAKVTSAFTDEYVRGFEHITINITKQYIDRYIGNELPEETILDILKRLEFGVKVLKAGEYQVSVPTFRATKDIALPCDLVEEITRIYGYGNIEAKPAYIETKPTKLNKAVDLEYRAKYLLASKFDFNEVHTYLWYDTATNQALGIEPKSNVKLVNALNKENSNLRATLVPALLKVVLENKTNFAEINVFEIGRVAGQIGKDDLVNEQRKLALVVASKNKTQAQVLTELKQAVAYLLQQELNLEFSIAPKTNEVDYYHPVNNYEFRANDEFVGEIAMLHPTVKNKLSKTHQVAVAELDFDKIIQMQENKVTFAPVSKFPVSEYDFSFVVPTNVLYSQIKASICKLTSKLSYDVSYVGVYETPQESTKTLTAKVRVWSPDHTLNTKELDGFYNKLIALFEREKLTIKQA